MPKFENMTLIGERLMDAEGFKALPEEFTFKELQAVADTVGIKIGQTRQFIHMALEVGGIERKIIHHKIYYKLIPFECQVPSLRK